MHAVSVELHRAPDPVPVDDPTQEPFDNPHPNHPPVQLPDADDDPVPDHKPLMTAVVPAEAETHAAFLQWQAFPLH